MTNVVDIAPFHIEPSPDNPRRDIGDVTELAASIKSVGILEPLLVKPHGKNRYQLIAGARRLAAAEVAGRLTVPCIVRDYNDEQRAEIMLIENLQRVDLSPIEEATAFGRLVDEFAWSQDKLAERIGRSQSHISKRLSLLKLPDEVVEKVHSGGMPIESALELTKLVKHPKRLSRSTAPRPPSPGMVFRTLLQREAKEAAVERRRDFARGLFVTRNVKPDELVGLLVGHVLSNLFEEDAFDVGMVCRFLGLQKPDDAGDEWQWAYDQLLRMGKGSDPQRLQLAAAAAAMDGERSEWHGRRRRRARGGPSWVTQAYLRFLEGQGYELNEEERASMTASMGIDEAAPE